MQSGQDPNFDLSCDGDIVGSIRISPHATGQYEAWNISLRSDQAAFVAPLEELIELHAKESFISTGPSAFEEWRSKMILGSYFGGGCNPQ
jgi:hypothetical protein